MTVRSDLTCSLETDRVQHCAEGNDNVVGHDFFDIGFQMPLGVLLAYMASFELLCR